MENDDLSYHLANKIGTDGSALALWVLVVGVLTGHDQGVVAGLASNGEKDRVRVCSASLVFFPSTHLEKQVKADGHD